MSYKLILSGELGARALKGNIMKLSSYLHMLNAWLIALLLAVFTSGVALGQDDDDDDDDDDESSYFEEFAAELAGKSLNRRNVQIRLKPLGFGLMGDSIDNHSGRLQFSVTDVSLEGNSDLPVALKRVAKGADASYMQKFFMADWELDLPKFTYSPSLQYGETDEKVYIPGYGSQLFFEDGIDPDPDLGFYGLPEGTDVGLYENYTVFEQPRWGGRLGGNSNAVTVNHNLITTDENVSVYNVSTGTTALSSAKVVFTPDGNKYTFGLMITRDAGRQYTIKTHTTSGGQYIDTDDNSNVTTLMVTEVTDKAGNWVRYDYNNEGYLTRIYSNDDREITLDYLSADGRKYVSSVTANNRVWTYEYKTVTDNDHDTYETRKLLHKVTQPDGKYWEYNLDRLVMGLPSPNGDFRGKYTTNASISVKHPYGTVATYQLGDVILDSQDIRDPRDVWRILDTFRIKSKAVFEKELELTNGEKLTWSYDYAHRAGYESEFVHVRGDAHAVGDRLKTLPDGSRIEAEYNQDTGEVYRSETYAPNSTAVLRRIENEFLGTKIPFGRFNGTNMSDYDEFRQSHKALIKSRKVIENGDIITTEYSYDLDPWSSTYSYNKPIQKSTYSNRDGSTTPRVTTFEYENQKDIWVIGLLSKASIDGKEVARFEFNDHGQLYQAYRYGQLNAKYGYYPYDGTSDSGALEWQEDALARKTTVKNWKRGTWQQLTRPDGRSQYQTIDDNGWVENYRDFKGQLTAYEYDPMGRTELINPPGDYFESTHISYDFDDPIYGAVQTIEKGEAITRVSYDSLFRTLLEETAIGTNTISFVNMKYDAMGRLSFTSNPSLSSTETNGYSTEYDYLGRKKISRQNGSIISRFFYNSNFANVTRDALGHDTTHYKNGYGELIKVTQPEGVTTEITRDGLGKPTKIRQFGFSGGFNVDKSQHLYYDQYERLCRYHTDEAGSKLYEYNAAGEIIRSNSGMPDGTSCSAVDTTHESYADTQYTALGQVQRVRYTRSPGSQYYSYGYDRNGNMTMAQRYRGSVLSVRHSYGFNELDLPTTGQTRIATNNQDGVGERYFFTDRKYSPEGHLSSRMYPGGRWIDYNPDALGRTGDVIDQGPDGVEGGLPGVGALALNSTYHPNGAVAGFDFGDGVGYFEQTLRSNLLPLFIKHKRSGPAVVNLQHFYDKNKRATKIVDWTDRSRDRVFEYDDLGRLERATTSDPLHGNIAYTYDALGNLRTKTYETGQHAGRTITMDYDGLNRLNRVNDRDQNTGVRSLSYDSRGNVTSYGGLNFVYDMTNRPVEISGSSAGTNGSDAGSIDTQYHTYDGQNRRIKTVEGDTVRYNIYDAGGTLIHIYDATTNVGTDYVSGPNGSLARIKRIAGVDEVTFIHDDHQGTARVGTAWGGAELWEDWHTPFGESLIHPDATDNRGDYTGHIRDKKTGLTYMQARYYDPVIGRFLSVDPATVLNKSLDPNFFGRYTYTHNDPVNLYDPDGMAGQKGKNRLKLTDEYVQRLEQELKDLKAKGGKDKARIKEIKRQLKTNDKAAQIRQSRQSKDKKDKKKRRKKKIKLPTPKGLLYDPFEDFLDKEYDKYLDEWEDIMEEEMEDLCEVADCEEEGNTGQVIIEDEDIASDDDYYYDDDDDNIEDGP